MISRHHARTACIVLGLQIRVIQCQALATYLAFGLQTMVRILHLVPARIAFGLLKKVSQRQTWSACLALAITELSISVERGQTECGISHATLLMDHPRRSCLVHISLSTSVVDSLYRSLIVHISVSLSGVGCTHQT